MAQMQHARFLRGVCFQGMDPDRRISGYLLISDLLGSILPYQIALGHYLVLSGLDRATIRTY